MQSRLRQLAAGLAVLQIVGAIASATPQMSMGARLDHLGVPRVLRSMLPVIKVSTSVGLLVSLRRPRVGAAASAVLVGFYAAAVGFHGFAGDHPAVALPAAAFGANAALCLVSCFMPAIEADNLV
ncbi:MAG: DoxX family protein [Acidimicrobiales bacterium]|jgi:hypothetical protein